jgi:ADP-ribose pyrophosphatase YjhB (NUDIX family)
MKTIITNDFNLKEEEMTEVVKRVKILLVNSKNEILLGYSNNEYQCPGGHVEEGETLVEAINREIQEETGIELDIKEAKPFACNHGYYKDWPSPGKNRKIEIYYYEIKTDEKPNLANTKYTDSEKEGNFELRYIPLDDVENEFIRNLKIHGDNHGIVKEMLKVFEIYKNNKSQYTIRRE